MILHSEVAVIGMTGLTEREIGTENGTETVIENGTEIVIVNGTEIVTGEGTIGTKTEVQI
jgi:hypothetical protein